MDQTISWEELSVLFLAIMLVFRVLIDFSILNHKIEQFSGTISLYVNPDCAVKKECVKKWRTETRSVLRGFSILGLIHKEFPYILVAVGGVIFVIIVIGTHLKSDVFAGENVVCLQYAGLILNSFLIGLGTIILAMSSALITNLLEKLKAKA